jgi:hypothetical protein
MKAIDSLCSAWQVTIIDPKWGRKQYLWRQLLRVIADGASSFDASPAPNLGLDTDFVY